MDEYRLYLEVKLYVRHTKNWLKPQSTPQDTEAESLAKSLCALCVLCGYIFSIQILVCPSYSRISTQAALASFEHDYPDVVFVRR